MYEKMSNILFYNKDLFSNKMLCGEVYYVVDMKVKSFEI